jgi:dTDP-4-amino-4,6-dideoxygalactose transaminase
MRIAGGMFGLEEELHSVQAANPSFMDESCLLFINARSAIQYLVDRLRPPQVWMPSYLCYSMIEAIDQMKTTLRFYPIGYDLELCSLAWLNRLIPGSLVLLIDYFGFPIDMSIVEEVHIRGSIILEDACQALLSSHVGACSDYVVYSPRKTVGVPDGGILQYKQGNQPPSASLMPPPAPWWLMAMEASIDRREYDKYGGERKWFELFRQVEASYPMGNYRMSELSEALLKSTFDYSSIALARRQNYSFLLDELNSFALYKVLDEATVPLGFPIRVNKRDKTREILISKQIYPPIHWEINECVPRRFVSSHKLSRHIMTIPCDQRLNFEDLARIVKSVRGAIDGK